MQTGEDGAGEREGVHQVRRRKLKMELYNLCVEKEETEDGAVQFLCWSRQAQRRLQLCDPFRAADKGAMPGFLLGVNSCIGHLTVNLSLS